MQMSFPTFASQRQGPTGKTVHSLRTHWRGPAAWLALVAALGVKALSAQVAAERVEFFEKKVRPILAKNCHACHNPEMKTAGLDLTTAAGFAAGAHGVPIVSAEDLAASRLLKVIGYEQAIKMPPTGKLKEEEIADLIAWVKMGAPWPEAAPTSSPPPAQPSRAFTEAQRSHWAFQPMRNPSPPAVRNRGWVKSPLDRFILARLEAKGLRPAPPADKETLLRRATYDLTGLPPTEKEIAEFLADGSPNAFARVVERLLASPRYGERWGRHWLDLARYADSAGNDEDYRYPYAWRYRDYVIEAFNQDTPYDQFVQEQIAGDRIPAPRRGEVNRRGLIATGLLALGQKALAQQDKQKMIYDVYDDQLDVVSKAIMGLSVTCARCHDHKFDPITTKDYYALVSIFASTKSFTDIQPLVSLMYFPPLVPASEYERYLSHKEKLYNKAIEIDAVVVKEIDRFDEPRFSRLADYMLAAHAVDSAGTSPADVAREKGLEPDTLAKWVNYLKPGVEEKKHLGSWYAAGKEERREAALGFQKRFEERAKEWKNSLRGWQKGIRERLKDRPHMPPPPRPKFAREKDPFLFDVYFSDGPFAHPENESEDFFAAESRELLTGLRKEFAELEKIAPPEIDLASAVVEGEPVNQNVFVRGDPHNPGEKVPKRFPVVLAGYDQPSIENGSGRWELAKWVTRPDHPLTARVMVNRIWHWHFGRGLFATTSDVGIRGEPPTHPELLDYLAREFVRNAWSIKHAHRLIMLSNTYQMSSRVTEPARTLDSENRLWSRFNPRRLDVEQIRDGLLAIDGTLDLTMGGSLLDFNTYTDEENSNDRLSLNPEKTNRRLVYLPLRRANLPPLLNMFDFGDATTPLGERSMTNVAPQALFMMNSEFIAERSRHLAKSLLEANEPGDAGRLERAYLRVLNRTPMPEEIRAGLDYLARARRNFAGESGELRSWQSICRILMASNEFIFVN